MTTTDHRRTLQRPSPPSRPRRTRRTRRSPCSGSASSSRPILFGLDKFLNWLVDWPIYLAPRIDDLVPGNAHQAMLAVGVIEIVAGLVVAVRPRFGGYLVAAWLAGIIINLLRARRLLRRRAARLRLAPRAVALARLATAYDRPRSGLTVTRG